MSFEVGSCKPKQKMIDFSAIPEPVTKAVTRLSSVSEEKSNARETSGRRIIKASHLLANSHKIRRRNRMITCVELPYLQVSLQNEA